MVEFGFYDINEILQIRINDFKIARNKRTHIKQEEKLDERGVRQTIGKIRFAPFGVVALF